MDGRERVGRAVSGLHYALAMVEGRDDKASLVAGRSPVAWLVFLGVMVVVLVVDLSSKYAAFEFVADRPVTLVRTDAERDAYYQANGFERYVIRFDDPGGVLWTQPGVVVLPGLLHFQLTTNTGAVFGLGAGNRGLLVGVSVLATGVVGWLFWFSPGGWRGWWQHVALGLVLAGAIGNLYDRVVYGAVRDMLHMLPGVVLPFGLSWPNGLREVWPWVFNGADVSLLVGVGVLVAGSWFGGRGDKVGG